MKLYHPVGISQAESLLQNGIPAGADFYSLNYLRNLYKNQTIQDLCWIVIEDTSLMQKLEPALSSRKGWTYFTLARPLQPDAFEIVYELPKKQLTSVLMNTSMLNESWIRPWMKHLIHKTDRVCIPALSYFNDTKNEHDWNLQYSPVNGQFYRAYQDVLYGYGLKPEQIVWIYPWHDSSAQMQSKILNSTILFLPGGAPELFSKRLKEHRLTSLLKNYSGLMIGVSAGAMVQLGRYHITPDSDYPEFSWQQGLGLHPDFDVECHYTRSKMQLEGIQKALEERPVPVYALYENGALMIDPVGTRTLYGKAELFEPDQQDR